MIALLALLALNALIALLALKTTPFGTTIALARFQIFPGSQISNLKFEIPRLALIALIALIALLALNALLALISLMALNALNALCALSQPRRLNTREHRDCGAQLCCAK